MDTRPWEKFETTKYLALMHEHPNNIVGQWFRVWCTLANSKTKWVKSGDIDTWCRVLGENRRRTKQFMTYASVNISNMKITSSISSEGSIITITEEYYKATDKQGRRKGEARHVRDTITNRRIELKEQIISAYHCNKRTIQLSTFNKEFNKIMVEANRIYTTTAEKIDAERNKCEEILTHIKWLSTTELWEGEGTFVLGIGNFMQNRAWEYDNKQCDVESKSDKDKIIEDIECAMEI